MTDRYEVHCDCGAVQLELNGSPRVRGFCHCGDCRELLNVPYHSVTAWMPDQVKISKGSDKLVFYQHPRLTMQRAYCNDCGEVLFNTNAADWRVVSQLLLSKCHEGVLPEALKPLSHFFYDRRVVSIDDELPKK